MARKVMIILGSGSDLPIAEAAAKTLAALGIEFTMTVASAHRTPDRVEELVGPARENGFGVVIAGAGMAAHLAGVCASKTTLPVIGIPLSGSKLVGVDALLATVQMPPGVPVATVGVDGAKNAALLAAQILSIEDPALTEKLAAQKQTMADGVLKAAANAEQIAATIRDTES